jgi:phosphatidylglycerophosphate synthase
MASPQRLQFVPVGKNPATLFGMDAAVRACRLAANFGMEPARQPDAGRATIVADMDFAWDPAWLRWIGGRPGTLLTLQGRPVLAHVAAGQAVGPALEAMRSGTRDGFDQLDEVPAEGAELSYAELRKRDRPFVLPLSAENVFDVERAAYDAAYKGVTDALTLYLWRKPAFHLTRWAAQAGLTPNMVTGVGALLCVLAFWLFWIGSYWLGIAAGFGFMVLDTVDGKLARCTGASSKWGNVLDHGIDLIHPLFWWWAWAHGLQAYGTPLEPVYQSMLIAALVVGYVAQRVIEGMFIRRYGMHIHVWQWIDSRFRLITARRNPNMVILVLALLFGRPDVGLELITLWTWLSLVFHAVRLAQANARNERGERIVSWLD